MVAAEQHRTFRQRPDDLHLAHEQTYQRDRRAWRDGGNRGHVTKIPEPTQPSSTFGSSEFWDHLLGIAEGLRADLDLVYHRHK